MIRFVPAIIALSLAAASTGHAQTKQDEEAVHDVPQAFCAAFNKHDGHELAQLMSEDVDFVTVGAMWLHGRPDFEKYHTRLLGGRFHGMALQQLQVATRFLRPDIAIVHWSWSGTGDKNPDGSAREPRSGMMTMVVEKRAGRWLIVVSQNDTSFPGKTPEAEGITSPMPMPNQLGPQPSN
jgi:uncharacterized protein (TIGR02246 family)